MRRFARIDFRVFAIAMVCLGALFCAAVLVGTAGAQGPAPATPTATPGPSPDEILAQALRTSQDADKAVTAVGIILNFLEVAGVIIGLLAAAATFAGFRTIFEYRSELNRAREELNSLRAELKGDAERASETLRGVEARVHSSMDEVRAQGERAIRALALLQLGEQQMAARNWKAALRTFAEAFEADPNNRATNYFLGELYVQQRNLDQGILHLERAQTGGTEFPPAEAALAYALRLLGDRQPDLNERNRYYARAEERFLAALAADPQVRDINGESVYGMLGSLYRRQGRIEDAIRCYKEAERITPQNSYPVNNLAQLYLRLGDHERAQTYFKRAARASERILDGNPFDYWARFDMITAYTALGEIDEALQQLDLALENPPGIGPLESLADGLKNLQGMAQPSQSPMVQGVERVLSRLQTAIEQYRARATSA